MIAKPLFKRPKHNLDRQRDQLPAQENILRNNGVTDSRREAMAMSRTDALLKYANTQTSTK